MISICIPVYNFNIVPMVEELLNQIEGTSCEIILIDDASSTKKEVNQTLEDRVKFVYLNENVGRSRIRNMFLDHAQHEFLLFLDCDSIIIRRDFITRYIQLVEDTNVTVVCGGRIYPEDPPEMNRMLRWKYGVDSESNSATERRKMGYKSFMTNNFLVKRSFFKRVQFDESLIQYGHEDTLFGFEIKKSGISIIHIDNPILNGDIETNEDYLAKTKAGIENLVKILTRIPDQNEFVGEVRLLEYHRQALERGRIKAFKRANRLFGKRILKKLLNGTATIKQFNYYKLMYLIECMEKAEKEGEQNSN